MEKKLQIFISSTYLDLKEERQSAVEAVLSTGHIPAGMELFSAGNESQLEVIKRWINDSDIFLLILGGRYGSIENNSNKSYIQLEFEYALELNKPLFSLVISNNYLDSKVSKSGKSVLELDNSNKYNVFKNVVTSNLVEFFNDNKDIQLAIHKTIRDFENRYEFDGWISGKNLQNTTELIKQNSQLLQENAELREKVDFLTLKTQETSNNLTNVEKIIKELKSINIDIPEEIKTNFSDKKTLTLYEILIHCREDFSKGITNAINIGDKEKFLYSKVVPKLILFSIMKEKGIYGKSFWRYILTDFGSELLTNELLKKSAKT